MESSNQFLKKDVGLATVVGAGLGAVHGSQTGRVVSCALLGAGVGAVVGLLSSSLRSQPEDNSAEREQTVDSDSNQAQK